MLEEESRRLQICEYAFVFVNDFVWQKMMKQTTTAMTMTTAIVIPFVMIVIRSSFQLESALAIQQLVMTILLSRKRPTKSTRTVVGIELGGFFLTISATLKAPTF
jgi:hypothetical protein